VFYLVKARGGNNSHFFSAIYNSKQKRGPIGPYCSRAHLRF